MATIHYLGERLPVEYIVRITHHFNGRIEIVVEGVGSSSDDRRKISDALVEAAVLIEDGDVQNK